MDMEWIRNVMTVAAFVTFLGILAWAWSGRNRARFEEASRLPFDDGELDGDLRTAQLARALNHGGRP